MRYRHLLSLLSAAALSCALSLHSISASAESEWPNEKQCSSLKDADDVTKGWCVSISRKKGNCLSCHTVNVSPWPTGLAASGNVAPPLVAMKARYPEPDKLREQIHDASKANPATVMPLMGKYGILTDEEIDNIVKLLHSI